MTSCSCRYLRHRGNVQRETCSRTASACHRNAPSNRFHRPLDEIKSQSVSWSDIGVSTPKEWFEQMGKIGTIDSWTRIADGEFDLRICFLPDRVNFHEDVAIPAAIFESIHDQVMQTVAQSGGIGHC